MGIEEVSSGRIGTLHRDRLKDEFVARMLDICGDVRFFALAQSGDTTTTVEKSRHAAIVTWSKDISTFDNPPNTLGEGYYWDFDGVDEEGDTPDVDRLSFGDGGNDNPFSILSLIKPDAFAATMIVVSKENSSSLEEYRVDISTSGYVTLNLSDDSSAGQIRATYETSLGTDWTLVGISYNGLSLKDGISIAVDGLNKTLTYGITTSHDAMEAGASLLRIANKYSTPQDFFNGKIAFILITGKELTTAEQWEIKTLVNWYYDLSL